MAIEQPDVIMPSIDEMLAALRPVLEESSIAPTDEPLPDDSDPEFGPDERL